MSQYVHRNMPLTAGVSRVLMRELFAEEGFVKRAEIIARVSKYRTENGGAATPKDSLCLSRENRIAWFGVSPTGRKAPRCRGVLADLLKKKKGDADVAKRKRCLTPTKVGCCQTGSGCNAILGSRFTYDISSHRCHIQMQRFVCDIHRVQPNIKSVLGKC